MALNDPRVPWAAGFFDGEGSIATPHRRNLQIGVGQTVVDPLLIFKQLFGGHVIEDRYARGRGGRLVAWRWYQSGLDAATTLRVLMPYLVVKADVARLAIEMSRGFQPMGTWSRRKLADSEIQRRIALADRIRALNLNT